MGKGDWEDVVAGRTMGLTFNLTSLVSDLHRGDNQLFTSCFMALGRVVDPVAAGLLECCTDRHCHSGVPDLD